MAAKNHRKQAGTYPPYTPINISFLGSHKTVLGEISAWRNNLSALSKRHNYLFVAVKTRIHVYVPEYPSQAISEEPLHVLESQPTGHSGYIDEANPHAINSLTVGELGREEVLVSAHDDGDVCIWYTRDLSKIALRRNVQYSAWGVALHKEKRRLAVSANSHLIYVFDLGIGSNGGKTKRAGTNGRMDDGKNKENINGGTPLAEPLIGVPQGPTDASFAAPEPGSVKILRGHGNNIPSISFLNHPSGNWLAGTSINGKVIVWDIAREKAAERCTIETNDRGWSVLYLQPECFLPTQSVYEGTGLSTSPSHPNYVRKLPDDDAPYDISPPHGRELAALQETFHQAQRDDRRREREWYASQVDDPVELEDDDSDDGELNFTMHHESDSGDYSMSDGMDDETDSDMDLLESTMGNNDYSSDSRTLAITAGDDTPPSVRSQSQIATAMPNSFSPHAFAFTQYATTMQDDESEDEEVTTWDSCRDSVPPPSLLFATSAHHAQLFEIPEPSHLVTSKFLLFSEKVNNALRHMGHRLHLMDRLSMSCSIPELSMALTATPKGRVAIFRLTRHDDEFMMRLDDIIPRDPADPVREVPIPNDEPQLPPRATMIGFAVGPIQGREVGRSRRNSEDGEFASDEGSDREDGKIQAGSGLNWRSKRKRGMWRGLEKRRRHRLIMVYSDGSVLSYELGGCSEFGIPGNTVLDGGYLMV